MKYFLGIDSGGTKTVCLVANAQGEIVSIGLGASGASLSNDGFAGNSIIPAINEAVLKLPKDSEIEYVFVSLGGLNVEEVRTSIQKRFPATKIEIERESSGNLLLNASKWWGFDIVVMAGTGSVVIALDRKLEKIISIGGWGYIIDDRGSGYAVGRDALRAIAEYFDGYGETTRIAHDMALNELFDNCHHSEVTAIFKKQPEELSFKEKNLLRAMLKQAMNKLNRTTVASLCKSVAISAKNGDDVALKIFQNAAESLAILAKNAIKLSKTASPTVLGLGGLFKADEIITVPFEDKIKEMLPDASISQSDFSLAQGAIFCALKHGGVKLNDNIIKNIKNSYKEFII